MNYELTNPSDPVTFVAPSLASAFLAVALVGGSSTGGQPLDERGERLTGDEEAANEVPIFLFGGAREWAHRRWPDLVPAIPTDNWGSALIDAHRADLVATLRSFLTATWGGRQLFNMAYELIPEATGRMAWAEAWEERHRSSMNDITRRAWALADRLEQGGAALLGLGLAVAALVSAVRGKD